MSKFDDHAQSVEAAHDAEVSAAIAEIVAGLPQHDAGEPEPVIPADQEQEAASAAAPVTGAPSVPDPALKPPADVTTDAAPDRGMVRLLEREGQIRDREAQVERREREYQARLSEVEARIADSTRLSEAFQRDPEEAFRLLGVDGQHVSRVLAARALGDKAPPELRRDVELDPLKREINQLKAEREQEKAQARYQAERERVLNGAREFARAVPTGEGTSKYPALAAVATTDAAFVEQEIFNEIARDAQERAAREPNGQPISPETAAERLNKRWETFSRAFTKPAPAAPATQSTNVTPPAQTAQAAPQPKKPSAPPPRKPYWERDRDTERDAALAEAVQIATGKIPAPQV